MKISASILSCNKVIPAVKKLSVTDVDYIHVDFLDGKFVKGKKIPWKRLKKLDKCTKKRLDVHLMTDKLKKYIKKFATLNAEYITFHIEVEDEIEKYIHMVHSYGIKVGLAINPETDIEELYPYLDQVDMILFMGVTPGYGGQEYNPKVTEKMKCLREHLIQNQLSLSFSVDGGMNQKTCQEVKPFADILVSGSYITNGEDFQKQIDTLR